MISASKTQVREYLRSSPLHENAFQDTEHTEHTEENTPHTIIEVPAGCFKISPEVHCEGDFYFLLRTVRFWLIPEYIEDSAGVFTFVLCNTNCICKAATDFAEDLPFLSKLSTVLQPPVSVRDDTIKQWL